MSAKESSTFISVSVCYSLARHAGVKVSIQGTKRPFQQSIAELFSVDNLPNSLVHHFFQSVLLAS